MTILYKTYDRYNTLKEIYYVLDIEANKLMAKKTINNVVYTIAKDIPSNSIDMIKLLDRIALLDIEFWEFYKPINNS